MSPEHFPPDDPREWLNRARSSLALAQTRPHEAYLEDLCFEAQQAAEKAIKGLLIQQGVAFPYVHDLARLPGLCSSPVDVGVGAASATTACLSRDYGRMGQGTTAPVVHQCAEN